MNGFEDNLFPRWLCYDYCGGEENLYQGSSSAVGFLFIPALADTCIVTPSITITKLKYSLTVTIREIPLCSMNSSSSLIYSTTKHEEVSFAFRPRECIKMSGGGGMS